MGLLDIAKAGATILLGKAVKKGVKGAGKAVIKGSKIVIQEHWATKERIFEHELGHAFGYKQ